MYFSEKWFSFADYYLLTSAISSHLHQWLSSSLIWPAIRTSNPSTLLSETHLPIFFTPDPLSSPSSPSFAFKSKLRLAAAFSCDLKLNAFTLMANPNASQMTLAEKLRCRTLFNEAEALCQILYLCLLAVTFKVLKEVRNWQKTTMIIEELRISFSNIGFFLLSRVVMMIKFELECIFQWMTK